MKLTNEELDVLLAKAGLRLSQKYSPRCSYSKTEWLRTACLACGTQADYRLARISDKNAIGEKVCRACTSCGWQTVERAATSASAAPAQGRRNRWRKTA